MPDWRTALAIAGVLYLHTSLGVCQDVPVHRRPSSGAGSSGSSLGHYKAGEAFLQQNNLQSAANEFRAALDGDLNPRWTVVWSHLFLGQIFDATGLHDRAINEYDQAVQTGDNTNGALDVAKSHLSGSGLKIVVPAMIPAREPIQKTEPEYTEEARLAQLEGTVVLTGSIDAEGFAQDLKVADSIGLGLDEKAIDAVKQWRFAPEVNPDEVQIHVQFQLPSKQSRWHLLAAHFDAPAGVSPPVFASALYPIGAGIGPEAMEEGRVLVAIGRVATAKIAFDVDEHGSPVNFRIVSASEDVWGPEATALVGHWRFTPGTKNGIRVAVPCTVELAWGERELTGDLERQLHDMLTPR